ncbi:hypothetical protein EYF80_062036 [Liparis tanakae]|uniref:Uncharacterized protein n=1 Tax=Liparis tanakae TaxID=230148 RepID=A0A4Z2EFU1_9TELE|nr:hypothetical protein EYF80_062036 [Liparis tanakae]
MTDGALVAAPSARRQTGRLPGPPPGASRHLASLSTAAPGGGAEVRRSGSRERRGQRSTTRNIGY